MKFFFQTVVIAGVLLSTGCATTDSGKEKPKPYLLDKCLVINRKLEGKTYTRVLDGQEYKFCCIPCTRTFDANPDPWVQKYREETGGSSTQSAEAPLASASTSP